MLKNDVISCKFNRNDVEWSWSIAKTSTKRARSENVYSLMRYRINRLEALRRFRFVQNIVYARRSVSLTNLKRETTLQHHRQN